MLRNYLKTALRSLLRHKMFTVINLFGLTVGLATSLFILLWIHDEITYDRFNRDIDRIFEVFEHQTYSSDKIYTFRATPGPLAEALTEEFPEVEMATRCTWGGRDLFEYMDHSFYAEGKFADSTLLKIFTFEWIEGDPDNPMPDQSSIVINASLAEKLFGDEDALGKMIRFRNQEDLKITGVFRDLPSNSSLQFEYVAPFFHFLKENTYMESWGNNGIMTFLKLKEGVDYRDFSSKITDYVKEKNNGSVVSLFLLAYKDLRLNSNFENGKHAGGRITYVRAFSFVAAFILVIACINFMNLTTARSSIRGREVGVRKVIGAGRSSLIRQFLGESFLMTAFAMMISIGLVWMLLQVFNQLTGKNVTLNLGSSTFWAGFLFILVITGTLSGSYPAFFLSSFRPVAVLKNQSSVTWKGAGVRKVLVVLQFALSVILIVSSLVIYRQINFLQNKNLGFDKENVMYFYDSQGIRKNYQAFRNEILGQSFINGMGKGNHLPYQVGSSSSNMKWDGKTDDVEILFQTYQTDYDMIRVLGFDLIDGRYFSPDHATDSSNYIVNEEAARRMGMENPVGENFEAWGKKGQIIGLVKDFHSNTLYSPIEPLIFIMNPENIWMNFVRIEPGKTAEAVASLERIYKKYEPVFPFEYHFLDKTYESLYQSEMTVGKLADYFTGIAIFIACLGLFGLSAFTVERRSKEISIRKIFGAGITRLVALLSKDFALLVLFAILLGSPVAWFAMRKFLSAYAFHTDISPMIFVKTGLGILIIALLTVLYQSLHAALNNPAEALRNE